MEAVERGRRGLAIVARGFGVSIALGFARESVIFIFHKLKPTSLSVIFISSFEL